MKTCPKCFKEIDERATVCPYCRSKQFIPPTKEQDLFNAIVVIGAVVAAVILFIFIL